MRSNESSNSLNKLGSIDVESEVDLYDSFHMSNDSFHSNMDLTESQSFFEKLKQCPTSNDILAGLGRKIAIYAPCFWCNEVFKKCFCRKDTNDIAHTNRFVLFRLNLLCAIFSAGQVILGMCLCVVYIILPHCSAKECAKNYVPNLWNGINAVLGLTFFGFVLFISSLNGIQVIRRVDLVGSLFYFWILQYIFPCK